VIVINKPFLIIFSGTVTFSIILSIFFQGTSQILVFNILELSRLSTLNLVKVDSLLPLSFSFVSGMLATVNPCGFVMLPVYISMFLSSKDRKGNQSNFVIKFLNVFQISISLGLGFLIIFGSVGLAITGGLLFIQPILSWLSILIGFFLVGLGIYTFSGKSLYLSFPQKLSYKINISQDSKFKKFFLYGLSYGVASISCTLPLFIALISNAINSGGLANGIKQFISYSLGMTSVILIITLLASFIKNFSLLKKTYLTRFYQYPAGILIALVGMYLIIYWIKYDYN
tara:strand:+ start:7019 stop:7873 length:855 start_codon:yes stop_codon:yes gene_type:complete